MKKQMVVLAGLAVASVSVAKPSFVVPDRIYAAVDHECNVYFANALDSAIPGAYAYEALCEKGRHEARRWCWTPKKEDAGTSQKLVLRAIDDTGLVAAATTTVTVAALADKSKPVAMATLTDSLSNCGFTRQAFYDMRKCGFANFRAVGTKDGRKAAAGGKKPADDGTKYDDIPHHDGNGGWTFACFLSRYQITETEFSKIQAEAERQQLESMGAVLAKGQEWRRSMSVSPFIRIENGKKVVDVQMWLDKVNGGKAPEVVIIALGGNGTFAPRDEEALHKMVDGFQIPNAKHLIAAVRKACPNSVIGLSTVPYGCSQDGYGTNYGCVQSSVQFRHNAFYINRALARMVEDLKDPRLYLFSSAVSLDPEESYPTLVLPPHARSTRKVETQVNALHLSEDGGGQFADAVVSFVLGHWSEY